MAPDVAPASWWESKISRQVSGDNLPVFRWVDILYVARVSLRRYGWRWWLSLVVAAYQWATLGVAVASGRDQDDIYDGPYAAAPQGKQLQYTE
jgi:hypothetical protein